jgi:putative tryptophan/tyrosine transport system substrate-binding protein
MKKERFLLWCTFFLASTLLFLSSCKGGPNPGGNSTKVHRVGIVQVASHPLLDSVRSGFTGRMKELGYNEGQNVVYDVQNAQGQPTTAQSIVQKFVSDQDALIFTIGTSPSQAAAKATNTIPIVFGAITDPVSAGLVKDPSHPGGNLTGTSDLSPFADQLKLLLQVAPKVKTIGMVYNSGEANSALPKLRRPRRSWACA